MTPEEKAKELQSKFNFALKNEIEHNAARNFASYNCALIVVDENLEYEKMLVEQIKNHVEIFKEMKFKTQNLFWESVKQELENL
jgi:hypothetical protein